MSGPPWCGLGRLSGPQSAKNHAFYDVLGGLGAENHAFYDVFWRPGAENHAFYDVFSHPAVTKLGFIARNPIRYARYRVFVVVLATWTRRNPRFNAMLGVCIEVITLISIKT